MRSPRLVSSALASTLALLAACGGDDGGTPTDARRIDARLIDAAAIDAAIDAPIDAPPAAVTNVWVFGDIVNNNTQQLGWFTHPVATPPATPTFVPAAGEMPFQNFPVPFSVALDSSRVVYVSRAAAADPWKLSYAAADGTGVVDVFTAPAGRTISDVSLSPDKTKIAFRADLETTAGQLDIYVVPAAANGTPVKISPDRTNAALDAQQYLSWSPDSRYLAFGGDFTTDSLNEVHIRDTQSNTTATALPASEILSTTTMLTRGLLSAPQWTAAGKIIFNARNTAANEARLYTANADGTGFAVLPNTLITRTDTTMAESSSFGLSPDGTTIAFAADGIIATAYELYVMPSTGAAAPTRITDGTIPANRGLDTFRPLRFSPDGTMIAFGADYGATNDKLQPYVLPIAGGIAPRRLAIIGMDTDAARDVQNIAWTGDSAFLYAIADGAAADNDPFAVYALDVSMTDQALTPIITPPASGDAFEVVTRW